MPDQGRKGGVSAVTTLHKGVIGAILALVLAGAAWQRPAAAKVSQVPRMLITDADGVQVDVRKVRIVALVKVFGETTPKRNVLSALPGLRGKGHLFVDIETIREFTVRDAGYSSVLTDMGLRDGEQLTFEVQIGRGDIVFEGLTRVGPYSISLKNMKGAVLQYD